MLSGLGRTRLAVNLTVAAAENHFLLFLVVRVPGARCQGPTCPAPRFLFFLSPWADGQATLGPVLPTPLWEVAACVLSRKLPHAQSLIRLDRERAACSRVFWWAWPRKSCGGGRCPLHSTFRPWSQAHMQIRSQHPRSLTPWNMCSSSLTCSSSLQ